MILLSAPSEMRSRDGRQVCRMGEAFRSSGSTAGPVARTRDKGYSHILLIDCLFDSSGIMCV